MITLLIIFSIWFVGVVIALPAFSMLDEQSPLKSAMLWPLTLIRSHYSDLTESNIVESTIPPIMSEYLDTKDIKAWAAKWRPILLNAARSGQRIVLFGPYTGRKWQYDQWGDAYYGGYHSYETPSSNLITVAAPELEIAEGQTSDDGSWSVTLRPKLITATTDLWAVYGSVSYAGMGGGWLQSIHNSREEAESDIIALESKPVTGPPVSWRTSPYVIQERGPIPLE